MTKTALPAEALCKGMACGGSAPGGDCHITTSANGGYSAESKSGIIKTLLVMTSRFARRHRTVKKFLLAMKLIAFLLTAACLNVAAKGISQNVTFSGKNISLEKVFSAVRQQTGYFFWYKENDLALAKPISIDVANQPLLQFLDEIFKNQPLKYVIESKTINIYPSTAKNIPGDNLSMLIPRSLVTGKIIDSLGKPIPGASVWLTPGGKGVSSNEAGIFTISDVAPGNYALHISLVGYQPVVMNISVLENHPFAAGNITLHISDLKLREVIIISTGYYQVPKERSAGSFSVVSADKMTQKSGSMNVVDRLEGLAPGIAFNYGQGNDKLLMRGASSVNLDRQPLIVLDGVPVAEYRNIESLVNPQDIKDITLLKDATAASIWGAQAANGVIVITTKSGQYNNDKINVSYNGFVSMKGMPEYNSLNVMSSANFVKANKELFSNPDYQAAFPYSMVSTGFLPRVYPHEQVYYDLASNAITEATANQRWDSLSALSNRGQIEKYFYQPALLTSHNISLSGGGKADRFFGSLSYNRYNNNDRSTRDHYLVNIKEELKIARWLTFDITGNMSYDRVHNQNVSIPTGLTFDTYIPYAMFAGNDGKLCRKAI